MDSDDEFDLDPYKYREGASDNEEYDVDTWSDEEGKRVRFESLLQKEKEFYDRS